MEITTRKLIKINISNNRMIKIKQFQLALMPSLKNYKYLQSKCINNLFNKINH